MVNLSVAIITFNEEDRIEACIRSVQDIADEVLVVDSFSTDNTQKICESLNVKFIQNEFAGHIEQKNFALNQSLYDYVLSLDADERLSQKAVDSIKKIKENPDAEGYIFKRLTNYCGKWIKHCGWYPDRKLRIVNKKVAKWTGENPHDRLELTEGKTKVINADILHYSFPSISSHVKTAEHFSNVASEQAIKKGKKVSFVFHVLLNPLYTFFKKYFFQLGILDGYFGLIICINSSYANFLKYTKIWQLNRENNHIKNG